MFIGSRLPGLRPVVLTDKQVEILKRIKDSPNTCKIVSKELPTEPTVVYDESGFPIIVVDNPTTIRNAGY